MPDQNQRTIDYMAMCQLQQQVIVDQGNVITLMGQCATSTGIVHAVKVACLAVAQQQLTADQNALTAAVIKLNND